MAVPGLQPIEYTDILNCCARGTPGCASVPRIRQVGYHRPMGTRTRDMCGGRQPFGRQSSPGSMCIAPAVRRAGSSTFERLTVTRWRALEASCSGSGARGVRSRRQCHGWNRHSDRQRNGRDALGVEGLVILRTVAGSPPRAPACAASISIPGSWATSSSAPTANRSGVSPTSPTSSEMSCIRLDASRLAGLCGKQTINALRSCLPHRSPAGRGA